MENIETLDFNTEWIWLLFKMILTKITLENYRNNSELMNFENVCWKSCVTNFDLKENEENVSEFIGKFEHCLKDCTAGSWEILKLSWKHAEITRMTFDRNIWKCDETYELDYTKLLNCYVINTDKVERWFFGYYQNEKNNLIKIL